jgi:hypothetical protein
MRGDKAIVVGREKVGQPRGRTHAHAPVEVAIFVPLDSIYTVVGGAAEPLHNKLEMKLDTKSRYSVVNPSYFVYLSCTVGHHRAALLYGSPPRSTFALSTVALVSRSRSTTPPATLWADYVLSVGSSIALGTKCSYHIKNTIKNIRQNRKQQNSGFYRGNKLLFDIYMGVDPYKNHLHKMYMDIVQSPLPESGPLCLPCRVSLHLIFQGLSEELDTVSERDMGSIWAFSAREIACVIR